MTNPVAVRTACYAPSPLDAMRRRPTLAAVLAVLALVLRLAAPALHTCRDGNAPARDSAHVGCSHTACRAHHAEIARSAPARAEVATIEPSFAADCACAVCGVVLLAPGFGPATEAEPRAPPACERAPQIDEQEAVRDTLRLGGCARAPPPTQRSV